MWKELKFDFSYLSLLLITLLFASGCTEEHSSIYIEELTNQKDSIVVNFELQEVEETKGTLPLKTGRYLTIYAYFQGETDQPAAVKQYKTVSPGILQSTTTPMMLDNGTYDFYVVGTNMPYNLNPSFTKGISLPLDNNVDYLWCKISGISIQNKELTIPITLKHICSKIIINITESFLTFVWYVNWVKISPPGGNQTLDLFTGVIEPSYYPENLLTQMNLNNQSCSIILLPYEGTAPLNLKLSVYSNLHLSPVYFEAEVAPPNGEFKPGKSYIFEAEIDDDIFTVKMNQELDWISSSDTDIN